jgi:hypothetical protein
VNGPESAEAQAIGSPPPPDVGSDNTGLRRSAIDPRVADLVSLAIRGLPASFIPDTLEFAQTVRAVRGWNQIQIVPEGTNLRYAAIVALGLATLPRSVHTEVLETATLTDLVSTVREQAMESTDLGAVALAAWVAAEVGGAPDLTLLARLAAELDSLRPLATVVAGWMLAAATASLRVANGAAGPAAAIAQQSRDRLLAAQGPDGIFPHALPAASLGRWRSHVGCFADQVYPIQALARFAALKGDDDALTGANLAAQRICALQGTAGQWWWHYDTRDGSVVEGYPVYSVHQHGMAPMALFDLVEAGGDDHTDEIVRGLDWLDRHPEVIDELVSDRRSQIWRKVGRREPAKAARKIGALTTLLRAGWHLRGLDAVLPPNKIDHECRPYELGWLLYAWHFGDTRQMEETS